MIKSSISCFTKHIITLNTTTIAPQFISCLFSRHKNNDLIHNYYDVIPHVQLCLPHCICAEWFATFQLFKCKFKLILLTNLHSLFVLVWLKVLFICCGMFVFKLKLITKNVDSIWSCHAQLVLFEIYTNSFSKSKFVIIFFKLMYIFFTTSIKF